jgi:signal transduction histidine kinase/PAS domain-containing protein
LDSHSRNEWLNSSGKLFYLKGGSFDLIHGKIYNSTGRSISANCQGAVTIDLLDDHEFSLELLDKFPQKAALLTEDLRITWMNEELEEVLGRDVKGEKCNEVYGDNLDDCKKCPLNVGLVPGETRKAVCEGALGGKELKLIHKGIEIDGDPFVLEIWEDVTEERRARRERARLASFPEKAPFPILEWNDELELVYQNPAARKYSEKYQGDRHPLAPDNLVDLYETLMGGGISSRFQEIACDDRVFTEYIYFLPGRSAIRVYAYDITSRKELTTKLIRSRRDLTLLGRCNRHLVRATDEEEFLENVCDTLVNAGNYDLAWIGFPEYDEEKTIKIVAASGRSSDRLKDMNLTWGHGGSREKPAGKAIREGEIVTVDQSEKRGSVSELENFSETDKLKTASFPLKIEGGIYGSLTVYSSDTGIFEEREKDLLVDLAEDVTFGLEALRERQARKSMEEELKELSGYLLHAREDERERISRLLHDELGQLATSAIIALSGLKDRDSISSDPVVKDEFEDITEIVKTMNEKLRDMAKDILPPSLEDEGLVSTLESYLEEVRINREVDINLETDEVESELGSQAQVHIYRVIKEAVTNSIRHGIPDRIEIKLKREENRARIVVRDDGKGFVKEEIMEKQGEKRRVGLIGMRERVRSLSGSLEIDSYPGEGTRLLAEIPLKKKNGLD